MRRSVSKIMRAVVHVIFSENSRVGNLRARNYPALLAAYVREGWKYYFGKPFGFKVLPVVLVMMAMLVVVVVIVVVAVSGGGGGSSDWAGTVPSDGHDRKESENN